MSNTNLNTIKKHLIYKHTHCYLLYSKKFINILVILLKYNLIKYYSISKFKNKLFFKISLTNFNNITILKKIILFSKNKINLHCSKNLVYKLNLLGLYIISTNNGLLTNFTCSLQNSGGVVINKLLF